MRQKGNIMDRRVRLKAVNSYVTCTLCKGYLIDATTITECLHTCEFQAAARNVVCSRMNRFFLSQFNKTVGVENLALPVDVVNLSFSVCKSCIVKYLEKNNKCPKCELVIHQSHPLNYIRSGSVCATPRAEGQFPFGVTSDASKNDVKTNIHACTSE